MPPSIISRVLQDCYGELESSLYSGQLVTYLLREKCINAEDRQLIQAETTQFDKSRQLLDILCRKNDSALDHILSYLREDGSQSHLEGVIHKSMLKFGPGKATEDPVSVSSTSRARKSVKIAAEDDETSAQSSVGIKGNKVQVNGGIDYKVLLIGVSVSVVIIATVYMSFISSAPIPIPSKAPSTPPTSTQPLTTYNLMQIRDLVTQDTVSLGKWSQVVDHIVASPSDQLRIKGELKRAEYEDAVLGSLKLWFAAGEGRPDLLKVLRDLGLNSLAGEIGKIGVQ